MMTPNTFQTKGNLAIIKILSKILKLNNSAKTKAGAEIYDDFFFPSVLGLFDLSPVGIQLPIFVSIGRYNRKPDIDTDSNEGSVSETCCNLFPGCHFP